MRYFDQQTKRSTPACILAQASSPTDRVSLNYGDRSLTLFEPVKNIELKLLYLLPTVVVYSYLFLLKYD